MKNLLFTVMLLSCLQLAAAPLEYSEGEWNRHRSGSGLPRTARWDGKVQSLTVNGKTITQPLSGTLSENQPVWKLGDTTTDLSIMLLRIGGTRR